MLPPGALLTTLMFEYVPSHKQECFGDPLKRDLNSAAFDSRASLIKRADFACPEATSNTLSPIVDGVLTAVARGAGSQ